MNTRVCFLGMLLTLLPTLIAAQERNNNWITGEGVWLDLNTGSPVVVPGQVEIASLPHAVMSDTTGALLFYFDGRAYYDASMDTMPHGIPDSLGLPFWLAQTQSIALPRPGWPDRYYVFMVDQYLWGGHVELDMTANGGQGDVISPSIVYDMDSAAETRIAATRHANGEDYWIVLHERGSDEFHAFRLGPAGLDPNPVVSHAGTSIQIGATAPDRYGRLKFNTQGDLLAHTSIAHYLPDSSIVELFHFDQWTGEVSFLAELPHYTSASGIEFSPDGQRLYCTHTFSPPGGFATTAIWQLSLDPLVETDIVNSAVVIGVDSSSYGLDQVNSTMELAPDGKIYVHIGAPDGVLAVINNPNAADLACGYDRNGPNTQAFAGNIRGLPNQCRRYHDSAPTWVTGLAENAPRDPVAAIVHPNPARDRITIHWPFSVRPAEVLLVDALGKIVLTTAASNGPVDVSRLCTGFYNVIGLDRSGAVIARTRFAKD